MNSLGAGAVYVRIGGFIQTHLSKNNEVSKKEASGLCTFFDAFGTLQNSACSIIELDGVGRLGSLTRAQADILHEAFAFIKLKTVRSAPRVQFLHTQRRASAVLPQPSVTENRDCYILPIC